MGPGGELRQALHRRDHPERDRHERQELLRTQQPALEHQVGSGPHQPDRDQRGEGLGERGGELRHPLGPDHPPGVAVRSLAEPALLERLPAERLDQPHAGHALLQGREQLALLAVRLPETTAQTPEHGTERPDHERRQDQGEQGEPPREEQQGGEVSRRLRHMSQSVGQGVAHDALGPAGVGQHPRDDLSRPGPLEKSQRQPLEVGVDVVPQVALDPFLHVHREEPCPVEEQVLEQQRGHEHEADAPERLQPIAGPDPASRHPLEDPLGQVSSPIRQHRPHVEQGAEERDQEEEAQGIERRGEDVAGQRPGEERGVGAKVGEEPPQAGVTVIRPGRGGRSIRAGGRSDAAHTPGPRPGSVTVRAASPAPPPGAVSGG